jgi:hypothetical protein
MAYVLIYRTQNYKRLKVTIDKLTKKCKLIFIYFSIILVILFAINR